MVESCISEGSLPTTAAELLSLSSDDSQKGLLHQIVPGLASIVTELAKGFAYLTRPAGGLVYRTRDLVLLASYLSDVH